MPAHLTILRMAVISQFFRAGGSGLGPLAGWLTILTTEFLMYRLKVNMVRVLLSAERVTGWMRCGIPETSKNWQFLILQFSNYWPIIPYAAPAVKP